MNEEGNMYYIFTVCILSLQILEILPKSSSTHWKLNIKSGQIEKSFVIFNLIDNCIE